MNRRDFVNRSTRATLGLGLGARFLCESRLEASSFSSERALSGISSGTADSVLAGTAPLTTNGDLAQQMVEGIHQFLLKESEREAVRREERWTRDYASVELYEKSVAPNRQRFQQIIGATDTRVTAQAPELVASLATPAQIANGKNYSVYAVRWPVFAPVTADSEGLDAEGLLLKPEGPPVARVVAIPDADWTPEMLAGLAPGISPAGTICATTGRDRVRSHCAVGHQSGRYILRHSRHRHDEYAASGMDLPDGL